MTRDELEAVVRRQLTRVAANALMSGVPSTGMMNRATETILDAADEYAVTGDTPATRRQLLYDARSIGGDRHQTLAEPTLSVTHLARERPPGALASACGRAGRGADTRWLGTTDPAKVTCRVCKRGGAYRAALAQAVAS